MREVYAQASRVDLRIGKGLCDVIDRSARDTFGVQLLNPERDGLRAENRFEFADQHFAVAHAAGVTPVACIGGKMRCTDGGTKLDELRIVSDGDDNVTVGCGKDLIR